MIIIYLYFSYHESIILSNEIKLRGKAICNNLATSAEDLLVMKDDLGLAKLIHDTKFKNSGVIYCFIIDQDKTIWAHTDISKINKAYKPPAGLKELGDESLLTQSYTMEDKKDIFEIAMPIMVGESKIGAAYVALSQDAIRNAMAQARKGVAFVTIVILVIGISGILVLVSIIVGSLGNITNDIEAIGNGDLDRNIVTSRNDEIVRITDAVRVMTKKLKKAQ